MGGRLRPVRYRQAGPLSRGSHRMRRRSSLPPPDATDHAPHEPAPAPVAPAASPWATPAPATAVPPGGDRGDHQDATGAEGAEPPPAVQVPLWQRLPLGWIVVGLFVAAGAVGGFIFNASRSDSGEITKSGDLAATDLRIGDCFDLKDPEADEIGDVTAVPCTTEHEYEMFLIGTMPEGPFPSDDGFVDWLDTNCVPAFGSYVGLAYEESELDIFWLQPTSEAWADGDRSIQCAVYHPRIHRLTESLKGSAQ